MIEVVFSESVKGSMKVGKSYKKENFIKGGFAYIGKPPTIEELERKYEGKPLGGNSEDVVGITLSLDIGDISGNITGIKRKQFILEMLKNPLGINENELNEEYWRRAISDVQKLKESASNGESIRIWYSDAPYSICGFYYVVSLLRDEPCRLSAIKLPDYQIFENGQVKEYVSWGELLPGKFFEFLKYESEISHTERIFLADRWRKLQKENGPLRAVVNGKLVSVEEEFYDDFIRNEIPSHDFKMGRVIGEVLGKHGLGIGDWWVAQRIRRMVENEELEVITSHELEYQSTLRRTARKT